MSKITKTAWLAITLAAIIGMPSISSASTIQSTDSRSRGEGRVLDLGFEDRASAFESRSSRNPYRSFSRNWLRSTTTDFDTSSSELRRSFERPSRKIMLRGKRSDRGRRGRLDGLDEGSDWAGIFIERQRPRPIPVPVGAVPEPTAALLFGAGVLVAGTVTRQRR